MKNDIFLKEAVARYKGFLHLIKRNRQLSVKRFCVPTYDIDLIWHSHQLYPAAYCKDLTTILGKVLQPMMHGHGYGIRVRVRYDTGIRFFSKKIGYGYVSRNNKNIYLLY